MLLNTLASSLSSWFFILTLVSVLAASTCKAQTNSLSLNQFNELEINSTVALIEIVSADNPDYIQSKISGLILGSEVLK